MAFWGINHSYAQFKPAPVEKSSQKMLYHGKVYYIHKVKKDQTLYSISRAYGITEQDIAVANPNVLLEVIKPGQALKIPEVSQLGNLSETYFGLTEDDFIYHTVKPQETLFYLSKKFSVPIELIVKYNPGTDELLPIGQVVKIPKTHVVSKALSMSPQPADTVSTYLVKQGDTLYSLAKKFGVSVADFITLNPELRWGLKSGMVLKIPGYSPFDVVFAASKKDSGSVPVEKIQLFNKAQCDSIHEKGVDNQLKLVLMLPFHAQDIMTLDSIINDSVRKAHPFNRYLSLNRSFLEYYQGFLIAIDSLKRAGINTTLFTYDTKSDTAEVQKILDELEIIRPNIIIGPIMNQNIKLVSAFSKENKIPLILPLSRNSQGSNFGNPYTVYMLPNRQTERDICSDYLSQYGNYNIVAIHNPDSVSIENYKTFKNTFFSYLAAKSIYESTVFKEFSINDSVNFNIQHALDAEKENIYIILSNKEADVINILGQLNLLSEKAKIKVFGLPSWQKYNNLRIEHLHKLNTVVYSPFFIDYTKPVTRNFIKTCRTKFGFEPYRTISSGSGFNFAFLGYETGLIFGTAYENYGMPFINCICTIRASMPQCEYSFKTVQRGGFTNRGINFIEYRDDFVIVRVPFEPTDKISGIGSEPEKTDDVIIQDIGEENEY
jgi:LysM repeat protein/ABC-type branched-subunit amino acid transport system substrate-binding protein